MKEYVIKKIANNIEDKGYNLQKLDIKMLIELGIDVPEKFRLIYGKGFDDSELKDFIYFNDYNSIEFIRNNQFIRDYIEFSNMNSFELELLINQYNQRINDLRNLANQLTNKDDLIELEHKLIILKYEMQSIVYLRNDVIKKEMKSK